MNAGAVMAVIRGQVSIGLDQFLERRQISQSEGRSLRPYESAMFEFHKSVGKAANTQSQQVGHKTRTEAIGYDRWIASFVAIVAGYSG
jgi:hypothetical protein